MEDVPWLDETENAAWRGLRRVNLLAIGEVQRDLHRDSGLSDADYDVLTALSETEDDRCRFGDLATRAGWSSSRLSHHVGRMQKRGLVERVERTDDGRSSDVVLTPLGRTTIEDAAPHHVRSVRRNLFAHLSARQIEQLATITAAILDPHEPAHE